MNKLSLFTLLAGSTLLSACLSGGGYMVANRTNTHTVTLEDYRKLISPDPQTKQYLQQLVGEYEVVDSWGNITYGIKKVSFHVNENKVYVLTYMNKRPNPSYKVEFSFCLSIPEKNGFDLRHVNPPSIYCSSGNRERSSVSFAKTGPDTTARLTNEEQFTSTLSFLLRIPDRYIPVKTPYVMKLQIWGDAHSEPVLGLRKIK